MGNALGVSNDAVKSGRAGGFGETFQCVWWTLRCGEGSILEDLETNTFFKFFQKPINPN
jgi:hypothetical protein